MEADIQLAPKLVPVFSGEARYRVAHGGRGSSKTRGFATMAAVDGYRFARAGVGGLILCGREHFNSLEESSMQEVKEAIRAHDWLDSFYEIGEKYIRTKCRRVNFAFAGLRHNIEATKSKARILRAWIDEAEDASETAWRTLIPTVREQGDWWQSEIWVSYNPKSKTSATHKRFREVDSPRIKRAELNWRDNPWFPEVLNQERLEDQLYRPETYNHVWEGDFLQLSDALIFLNRYAVRDFIPQSDWDGPYFGLDFGFSQDATAGTKCWIHDNCLYIEHELYQKKLELDATPAELLRKLPGAGMHVVRCDSARPESISYLKHHLIPLAQAAKKGKGSVEDGIEYMKSFREIIIHPRCVETAQEFANYSYKVDRLSGDVLPKIIDDKWNHCIDSIRYALEPMIRFKAKPRLRLL